MTNLLNQIKKIHFIGIGGSGMCPMAEILLNKGYQITGSDANESETLERIRTYGIKVHLGHKAENVGDAELVVYTAAAKKDNPEILYAKEMGIPTLERSVVLGMLTGNFEKSIAVSGTHGKTSTTAMITQVLIQASFDPSAIIGGRLPLIGGNSRTGDSEYIVCEACEYVDTFLQLNPAISVILNVEADHLDYFKNLDNIIKSFNQFSKQTSSLIVVNGDDENALKCVEDIKNAEIVTFGLNKNNDYRAINIQEGSFACNTFTVLYKNSEIATITLKVPGKHNLLDALAAFATTHHIGANVNSITEALESFGGVHRRFEILGKFNGITVADDFAHHPTELEMTLTSASKMGFNNVWAIFQPHTFSRTFLLLEDFARVLAIPEHLVMTEILAVREENIYGIDIMDLENKVPNSCHFKTFEEISNYVMANAKEGDLIITLGGGDIYKCANLIASKYQS